MLLVMSDVLFLHVSLSHVESIHLCPLSWAPFILVVSLTPVCVTLIKVAVKSSVTQPQKVSNVPKYNVYLLT